MKPGEKKLSVEEAVERYIVAFPRACAPEYTELFLSTASRISRLRKYGLPITHVNLDLVSVAGEIVTSCEDPVALFETLAAISRLHPQITDE